ncbi:MAG: hypothetical protein IT467_11530 [Dokdonella sp.]|nr:hypothetical protein [Dokdonella sp.]
MIREEPVDRLACAFPPTDPDGGDGALQTTRVLMPNAALDSEAIPRSPQARTARTLIAVMLSTHNAVANAHHAMMDHADMTFAFIGSFLFPLTGCLTMQ